jgi:hypothetical protein
LPNIAHRYLPVSFTDSLLSATKANANKQPIKLM